MVGIYSIRNKLTGQEYIGQSIDIERRWMEHKTPKANGNDRLHSDMQRHGIEKFEFRVLEECEPEKLNERELFHIRQANPFYNAVGKKKSEETKRRISEATKRWWESLPDEAKQKVVRENLIGPRKGHEVSAETREKISKKVSEAQKQKVRCLETGEIFESVGAFEEAYAYPGSCAAYWKGRIKSVKGLHVEKCRD